MARVLSVLVGFGLALTASTAAADFRGFAVPISCTALDGAPWWANGVYRDDGTIELRQPECDLVDRAVAGGLRDRQDVSDAAFAIYTLAHELSHALGTRDDDVGSAGEDSTEPDCVGWMLYPWVVQTLHVPAATGKKLTDAVRAHGTHACRRLAQRR